MDIQFECIFEGKKLYQVVREQSDQALFTGTVAQCKRFLEVYQEKVTRARNRDRKVGRLPSLALPLAMET